MSKAIKETNKIAGKQNEFTALLFLALYGKIGLKVLPFVLISRGPF